MNFLNILNQLDTKFKRTTRHYKQKNTPAIIYNTTNHEINLNDQTYNPQAILVYNTDTTQELSLQTYNTQHTFKLEDIDTLEIT